MSNRLICIDILQLIEIRSIGGYLAMTREKKPDKTMGLSGEIHPYEKAGGDGTNYINRHSAGLLSIGDARYTFY